MGIILKMIGRNGLKLKSIEIFYKYELKYVEVDKIGFTNEKNKVVKLGWSGLKLIEVSWSCLKYKKKNLKDIGISS